MTAGMEKLVPSMHTPTRRVRGLGSAHHGTEHFIRQRVTAVAQIVLVTAFVAIVLALRGRDHAGAVQLLSRPFVAIPMLLLIGSVGLHMRIGMQVIIEDYLHTQETKIPALLLNHFFGIAVAVASAFALLKISFGM